MAGMGRLRLEVKRSARSAAVVMVMVALGLTSLAVIFATAPLVRALQELAYAFKAKAV